MPSGGHGWALAKPSPYGGWASEILHQLKTVVNIHVYPIIYRLSTICLVMQDFACPSTT